MLDWISETLQLACMFKHVQVPIRPLLREIGHAHVTALASRPKLIGGARAHYPQDSIRKS